MRNQFKTIYQRVDQEQKLLETHWWILNYIKKLKRNQENFWNKYIKKQKKTGKGTLGDNFELYRETKSKFSV